MATAKKAASAPATVKVLVLCDCFYGKVGEVVELPAAELAQAVALGCVDPHPDAVAYAQSLQPQG